MQSRQVHSLSRSHKFFCCRKALATECSTDLMPVAGSCEQPLADKQPLRLLTRNYLSAFIFSFWFTVRSRPADGFLTGNFVETSTSPGLFEDNLTVQFILHLKFIFVKCLFKIFTFYFFLLHLLSLCVFHLYRLRTLNSRSASLRISFFAISCRLSYSFYLLQDR